jgi:hypothetical protein
MDWSTVILSAAVSAVVGALVSLAAVSQTTVRQRRAERRDEALLALKKIVVPLRLDLRLYELGVRTGNKRTAERSHVDDHRLATAVLDSTENMGKLRSALVRRRCRRVFGEYWATLAEEMPYADDSLGSAVVPALLGAPMLLESGALKSSPVAGLMHRAYMGDPGSPEQTQLRRELRRLSAGW